MENIDKAEDDIISVLEALKLYPIKVKNSPLYVARCPIDRAHRMFVDNYKNTWECDICKATGDILDLKYHECLSDIKSLRDSISIGLEELNAIAGTEYSLSEAVNNDIQEIDNEDFRNQMAVFKAKTELYRNRYQMLEQYRLSVMNRDLNEGKELNDDITGWWANRY